MASGNSSIINDVIDNLYAMRKIKNRTEKSWMKKDISTLIAKANKNEKNELIVELDKKIELFKQMIWEMAVQQGIVYGYTSKTKKLEQLSTSKVRKKDGTIIQIWKGVVYPFESQSFLTLKNQ